MSSNQNKYLKKKKADLKSRKKQEKMDKRVERNKLKKERKELGIEPDMIGEPAQDIERLKLLQRETKNKDSDEENDLKD